MNAREARRSLSRIVPRLRAAFHAPYGGRWEAFEARLEPHFEPIFDVLYALYGDRYDFFYHLEAVMQVAASSWLERSGELKALDAAREADPTWFQSEKTMGAVGYVDLLTHDLAGVRRMVPYFRELGLTYLHLMPLFRAPEGPNDGGYAVSSYREVEPALGTTEDLRTLAEELRRHGISLVLDFVFNHTSDEHDWALAAQSGDPDYQDLYYLFPDRAGADAYAPYLRDIFPQERAGSFTYRPDIDRWVWTTFHSYQWDLNYRNPDVFVRMAGEMLALANLGVDVLRLDAVAFAWKQAGTRSESLPEVHLLVRAFNAVARLAAPGLLFKSEAIVHPDEVASYIAPEECQLSYNPLLMALLWEALATRQVRLLWLSMSRHFAIDRRCSWVNYVRSHDDIGWTFDDADAQQLGINPIAHRQFLNAFYTGRFPGSFARGLPFGENPRTGDMRISGTCASLAGLEKALDEGDMQEIERSIRRIVLLYSVVLSIGGIPLLYLGDELGTLNDYAYTTVPQKSDDSRWVHRPRLDVAVQEARHDLDSISGRIFSRLTQLVRIRKDCPSFAGGDMRLMNLGHEHVLGYIRPGDGSSVFVLANFSERTQTVSATAIRGHGADVWMLDLVSGETVAIEDDLTLEPYAVLWLSGVGTRSGE